MGFPPDYFGPDDPHEIPDDGSAACPFIGMNFDETNATRKLLQLALEYLLNGESPFEVRDIPKELEIRLKGIVKEVKEQYKVIKEKPGYNGPEPTCKIFGGTERGDPDRWTTILDCYELYRGYPKNNVEMGELVFVHESRKKFILVNLCDSIKSPDGSNNLEEHYEARLRSHAQRFLALAHYLPIGGVEWIRATYVTSEHPHLYQKLLDNFESTIPSQPGVPPVLHLTPNDIQPCLTSKDLSRLDAYCLRNQFTPTSDPEIRGKVSLVDGAEDPTEIKLEGFNFDLGKPPLEKPCDGCEKYFPALQLQACSACHGVLYCSRKCQKLDWKRHEATLCRKKIPKSPPSPSS